MLFKRMSREMNIKPSTTIRQDYNGFLKYCYELDEPVMITRNGEADLVVMRHFAAWKPALNYNLSY